MSGKESDRKSRKNRDSKMSPRKLEEIQVGDVIISGTVPITVPTINLAANATFSSLNSVGRRLTSLENKMKAGTIEADMVKDIRTEVDHLRNNLKPIMDAFGGSEQQIQAKVDTMAAWAVIDRKLTEKISPLERELTEIRTLFGGTVKRIDERINGLGKRIDDLRETKLWSKRTVIDIVLAIIATASTIIAALLASGYLHL